MTTKPSEEAADWRSKGLPHGTVDVGLPEIVAKRWNVLREDLPLPLALLRASALTRNRRWMREFLFKTGAKLAPHGKTHMSPEIFNWQLADGAWAITLATIQQVRIARQAGIDRILVANEIVGPRDIEYICDELEQHPDFDFYCIVDSLAGIERFAKAARSRLLKRPLQLLVEVGFEGGRTGCRDAQSALVVARAIKDAEPWLVLRGVEGFEGLHGYLANSEGVPKARQLLEQIVEVAQRFDTENLFGTGEIILSAGGSAYYDLVADTFTRAQLRRKPLVVLRSGCYFTHDAGWYERLFSEVVERSSVARSIGQRFDNALEVWTYVLSVPEPGRAILGAGRRDFGHDAGSPVPLQHYRPGVVGPPSVLTREFQIVGINDQHAHMTFPAHTDIQVGDMIALGVSHPCTTFDKWQLLYVVNDGYDIESAVRTHF
jgi:D-serine dehydratase